MLLVEVSGRVLIDLVFSVMTDRANRFDTAKTCGPRNAQRLEINGQLFHLLIVRPVFVLKTAALMHREGQHDVRIRRGADRQHVRFPVAGDELSPAAVLAQGHVAHRGAVFYMQFAHDSSFLSGPAGGSMAGEQAATVFYGALTTELSGLASRRGNRTRVPRLSRRSIRCLHHRPRWLLVRTHHKLHSPNCFGRGTSGNRTFTDVRPWTKHSRVECCGIRTRILRPEVPVAYATGQGGCFGALVKSSAAKFQGRGTSGGGICPTLCH